MLGFLARPDGVIEIVTGGEEGVAGYLLPVVVMLPSGATAPLLKLLSGMTVPV